MRRAADWRVHEILASYRELLELLSEGDVPVGVIFEDQSGRQLVLHNPAKSMISDILGLRSYLAYLWAKSM